MKLGNKQAKLSPYGKNSVTSYAIVVAMFVIMSILKGAGLLTSQIQGLLVPVCVYIVMTVSLNLVVGISGELSLGHAGFMSVGAFVGVVCSAYMQLYTTSGPLRLVVAIIVGGIAAGIVGFLIGIPVLRLRGDYLAIVTLAFGEIIRNVLNIVYVGVDEDGLHISTDSNMELLAGGKKVLSGPMGSIGTQKLATFLAGFILILVALFIVQNLVNSKTGRAIMAIRDNRIAAESIGLSVMKYKMIAFVISAIIAGMAGALFGLNYSTLLPAKFGFNQSILILVFVVLGGIGNIWGGIISATVLTVLPEALREFADYRMLAYAVVLIVVMICTYNPKIKGRIQVITSKAKKNKAAKNKKAEEAKAEAVAPTPAPEMEVVETKEEVAETKEEVCEEAAETLEPAAEVVEGGAQNE